MCNSGLLDSSSVSCVCERREEEEEGGGGCGIRTNLFSGLVNDFVEPRQPVGSVV